MNNTSYCTVRTLSRYFGIRSANALDVDTAISEIFNTHALPARNRKLIRSVTMIAECLSVRRPILQCRPQFQLAFVYIYRLKFAKRN